MSDRETLGELFPYLQKLDSRYSEVALALRFSDHIWIYPIDRKPTVGVQTCTMYNPLGGHPIRKSTSCRVKLTSDRVRDAEAIHAAVEKYQRFIDEALREEKRIWDEHHEKIRVKNALNIEYRQELKRLRGDGLLELSHLSAKYGPPESDEGAGTLVIRLEKATPKEAARLWAKVLELVEREQ